MASTDEIRTLTVRAKQEGVDATTASLKGLAAAHESVGAASSGASSLMSAWEKGLSGIQKSAADAIGSLSGLGPAFAGAFGAFSVVKFLEFLKGANEEMSKMLDTARLIGISTDKLQASEYAGSVAGLKAGKTTEAIDAIDKALQESLKAGYEANDFTKILEKNNVDWRENGKLIISSTEALAKYIDIIRNAKTERDKPWFAEKGGLDESFVKVANKMSGAQFQALADGAKDAGAVLDREILDKAAAFQEKWDSASAKVTAFLKAKIYEIVPDLDSIVDKFKNMVEEATKTGGKSLLPTITVDEGSLVAEIIDKFNKFFNNPDVKGHADGFKDSLKAMFSTFETGNPEIDKAIRGLTDFAAKAEEIRKQQSEAPFESNYTKPLFPPTGDQSSVGLVDFDKLDKQLEGIKKQTTAHLALAQSIGMAAGAAAEYIKVKELDAFVTEKKIQLDDDHREEIEKVAKAYGAAAQALAGARLQEGARERELVARQSVTTAQLELDILGKTIGEQSRLRTELQTRLQLEREAAQNHTSVDEAHLARLNEQIKKTAELKQLEAENALRREIGFERSQIGLTDSEQQINARLRAIYGDQYASSLADADRAALRLNETLRQTNDISKDAFKGFIQDIYAGKSAMDALSNALNKISQKLLDMAADQLWSAAFGGKGGTGGLLGSLFGQLKPGATGGGQVVGDVVGPPMAVGVGHTGGIIGSGELAGRYVHASYFDSAPRFHGGGIAGGEVPILARDGEGIFTKQQMAAMGGSHVQVNVINNASGTAVQTRERSEGGVDIRDVIISTVSDGMASGKFDGVQRQRFGNPLRPRPR